MGITIDEAIRRIDEHSHIHQHKEPKASVYITAAFDVAVDIMRKYQKIEQIIADYEEYDIKDIREIIDGNDD